MYVTDLMQLNQHNAKNKFALIVINPVYADVHLVSGIVSSVTRPSQVLPTHSRGKFKNHSFPNQPWLNTNVSNVARFLPAKFLKSDLFALPVTQRFFINLVKTLSR